MKMDSTGTIDDLVHSRFLDRSIQIAESSGYNFAVIPSQFNFLATASRTSAFIGRYEYFITGDVCVRYSKNSELAPPGRAGLPVE
jgi:hypothetical protein